MCLVVRVEVVTRRSTLVGRAAELVHVETVLGGVLETTQIYLYLRRSTEQLRVQSKHHHTRSP